MAVTLNASASSGFVTTADTSTILQLQTNGTTAVTVDASANVGIGTASPSYKLDVSGGVSWLPGVTGAPRGYLSGASADQSIEIGSLTNSPFGITTNAVRRMTIDTSGNLGIGVTPSAWDVAYKAIDILYGSIANTQSGSVDVAITQNAYYNGTNWITKYTGASKRYVLNDSGHLWFTGASATSGTAITFTERMRIDTSGNVLVTSAAGLGYGTGSGGTVTQATSKSTAVTLNKPTGTITMNAAALAANTNVTFQFNNSVIAANDIVVTNLQYSANYQVWSYTTGAGYAYMVLRNISGGSLSEAVVFSFAVIKGATS